MSEILDLLKNLWAETPSEDKTFIVFLFFLGVALQKVRTSTPFPSGMIPLAIFAVSFIGMWGLYNDLYYAISRGVGYASFVVSVYEIGLKYLMRKLGMAIPKELVALILTFLGVVIISGCATDEAEQKRAERPAAVAGTLDVKFDRTTSDGETSSVSISATDYKSDKEINFSFDEHGNPTFSSAFKPKQSKEFYDALKVIIGSDAPENVLGRLVKEGFDGAGRQINPLNPALHQITPSQASALFEGLKRLKQESNATTLPNQ